MRLGFAAILLLVPLAAPAETLTGTWTPRSDREAALLRGALALHAIRYGLRNEGRIDQLGRGNLAELIQADRGNLGVVQQRGRNHSALLDQSGDGNAHVILQAGRGAQAEVAQDGGEVGVTVQLGW